jgi:parallel beta-helix repeat protein
MLCIRGVVPLVAAGGLALAFAAPASAATTTLYVNNGSSSCSDTGAGTSAVPFCTIGAAALKAVAGTTVQVAAGSYAGGVTVKNSGVAGSPVVFSAAPGVTVTGGTNGFKVSSKNYVTITGFRVTGTTGVGILVSGSSNVVLDSNDVSGAGQQVSGLEAKGISLSGTTSSTLTRNVTHNNSDAGIGVSSASSGNTLSGNESYGNARGFSRAAAGIDLRGSTGNTVVANRLHDNEDSGLNIWNGSDGTLAVNNVIWSNGDHGIDVHSTNNARVISNSVDRNYDSGIEMTGSLGTVLANNISADNGINSARTSGQVRADTTSAPSTTLDHDLLFLSVAPGGRTVYIDWNGTKYTTLAAFTAATGQEAHGLSANPLFAGAPTNLHLTAASPAIGQADATVSGESSVDADGKARTAPYDLGAYEF